MIEDSLPYERAFGEWLDRSGMSWERVQLDPPGNGKAGTAYRLSPADRPRRVVLALHGAGNDALFAWVGLFKRLLLGGSEILTFDLPGHGRVGSGFFGVEEAGAALATAAAACGRSPFGLPVHAVGVSLGGSLLLHSLPRLQDRFTSAALIVAPLQIQLSPRSVLAELRPRNFRLLLREREHYGLTGLIPSFGPFKRGTYPLRLQNPAPPGSFGYVESLNQLLAEMEIERAAANIQIPTLLIYGERDRIVPLEQGAKLARIIPQAEFHAIPGGTHLSTPLEPEANELLMTWLEIPD